MVVVGGVYTNNLCREELVSNFLARLDTGQEEEEEVGTALSHLVRYRVALNNVSGFFFVLNRNEAAP